MATASYFFSSSVPAGQDRPYSAPGVGAASSGPVGSLNCGTATYASDALEIRMTTNTSGYTPTKRDVVNFLRQVERWLFDQEGSSTISGQGLDALLLANSATVGIP
jgi:hypothetical protein